MSDVRGPQVAHLQRKAEAGAPPPSLSTSLGARALGAPAESILTSRGFSREKVTVGDLSRCVKWCIKPPIRHPAVRTYASQSQPLRRHQADWSPIQSKIEADGPHAKQSEKHHVQLQLHQARVMSRQQ